MDFTNTSPYGPESRASAAESVTGLSAAPTVTPDSFRTPLTCPPRPYDSVKRLLDLFAGSKKREVNLVGHRGSVGGIDARGQIVHLKAFILC